MTRGRMEQTREMGGKQYLKQEDKKDESNEDPVVFGEAAAGD